MRKIRYAIYFSPKLKSPLWVFGAKLMGRTSERLSVKGLSKKTLEDITQTPARYGFHATLKAPFVLAKGRKFEELDEALEKFTQTHSPVTIPALELAQIDNFLALRPSKKCPKVDALAADCVKEFDDFRSAFSAKELTRRLDNDLSKNQKKMLQEWGYPFVMDEFRFHMTLTENLNSKDLKNTKIALSPYVEKVTGQDVVMNNITLFQQYSENAAFEELKRYTFKGK